MSNDKSETQLKAKELSKTFTIKASHYIIAGFGVVAGLAWRDVIKDTINMAWPGKEDSMRANFIYALIITALLVLVIYMLPDTTPELPKPVKKKIENLKTKLMIEKLQMENTKLKKELQYQFQYN